MNARWPLVGGACGCVPVGQPRLRRPQVPAAQQPAAVTAVGPLPRPDQQPGVVLDPVQVGVQGLDQFPKLASNLASSSKKIQFRSATAWAIGWPSRADGAAAG